jgi:branched-chain amino acid transport system substrate-binding protein
MSKFIKLFFLSFVLMAFVFGCGGKKEEATILNIGSMSPLTGPYAADGNDIANGVRAAIAVIKEEGGIPGFSDIVLHSGDTACDPRQAVAAANKLINEEVVGVIGAYCSSSTIPSSEVLDEKNIIMITPASTNEKVTERGLKYMFRMCGRDDDQSKSAGKFLSYIKAKTIFIVDDKTTYSQGLAENVVKECEKRGITVLKHDHVNQGDKDFSAVLAKVKALKPDAFYISLQNSASGSVMAIQTKRMGIRSAILSQDAVYHPNFIEVAKEAAEGVYLTYGFQDKESATYQKFINKFEAVTDSDKQPGGYATYAYDAGIVLLRAIKNAGSTDPVKIKEEIMKSDFDGASKHVRFMENGDSGSNYIIFKIENGDFINYWNPETGSLF